MSFNQVVIATMLGNLIFAILSIILKKFNQSMSKQKELT